MSGQLGPIPYPVWQDDPNTQWQQPTPQTFVGGAPGRSVGVPQGWPWWPGAPIWQDTTAQPVSYTGSTSANASAPSPGWFMPENYGGGSVNNRPTLDLSPPSWDWQPSAAAAPAPASVAAAPPAAVAPDTPMPVVHIGPDGKPDRPATTTTNTAAPFQGTTAAKEIPKPAATPAEKAKEAQKPAAPPESEWDAWLKKPWQPSYATTREASWKPWEAVPAAVVQPMTWQQMMRPTPGSQTGSYNRDHEETAMRYRNMLSR